MSSYSATLRQLNLFDALEAHDFSVERMNKQMQSVFDLMQDGRWRTLRNISIMTHYPEPSVSARLRDLRKKGHLVNKRKLHNSHLYEYQVLSPS